MLEESVIDDTKTGQDQTPEDSSAKEKTVEHILEFSLCGFDGEPINGLECRIKVSHQTYDFTSDAEGKIPPIKHTPGSRFSFNVKRDDGTYKEIAASITDAGHSIYVLISPKFIVETNTELHEGDAGGMEKEIPKPEPMPEVAPKVTAGKDAEKN